MNYRTMTLQADDVVFWRLDRNLRRIQQQRWGRIIKPLAYASRYAPIWLVKKRLPSFSVEKASFHAGS